MSERGPGSVTIGLRALRNCAPEEAPKLLEAATEAILKHFGTQLGAISRRATYAYPDVVVLEGTMAPVDDAILEILRAIRAGRIEVRDRWQIRVFLARRAKSRALDRVRKALYEAEHRSPVGLPEGGGLDDGGLTPEEQVILDETIEGLVARVVEVAPRYSLILRGLLEGRPIPEIMEQTGRTRPSFYRDLQEVRRIAAAYFREVYEIEVRR